MVNYFYQEAFANQLQKFKNKIQFFLPCIKSNKFIIFESFSFYNIEISQISVEDIRSSSLYKLIFLLQHIHHLFALPLI